MPAHEETPGRDQPTEGAHQDANSSSVGDHRAQDEALHDGLGGITPEIVDFALRLVVLTAPVWVASPGEGKGEFHRPSGWPELSADTSPDRIRQFRPGMALCVNTGGVLVVVDVDPRNGGDIEKVRNLLVKLKVRVFAEVVTPSGGQHFYIAGHPALPTIHSTTKNGKLPGFPGVDVQSFGANVFLPGTQRPKYGGAGYTIVFDDLDALADGGDRDGAESFSQWVAKCVGQTKKRAGARDSDFTFERSRPWNGAAPDTRQQAYLDTVLLENAKTVAQTPPGGRNDALYLAALKCASLVAGGGMDQQLVVDVLGDAATECGLAEDDGLDAVHATIASAFKGGLQSPRAVPGHPDHLGDFEGDPNAPAASDDYPVNPYPPFTADDFRQLASGVTPDRRIASRARQVVADATWDHTVRHRHYNHPWCPACLDDWRVASGLSVTDMDSGRVARSRAARYLLLRNNPPADSFDPDLEVDNLDDEFLLGDQLDELPAPESLIDGVLTRHAYGIIRGRDASFKSFITLDWALCLATGTRWQGRATERVKVLYVAGEGAYGLAERKRAWESVRGVAVDPEWFVVRTSAVNLYRTAAAFDHLLRHMVASTRVVYEPDLMVDAGVS